VKTVRELSVAGPCITLGVVLRETASRISYRDRHGTYQSHIELRAAYMPDAAWAVSVHPPSSSRKMGQPPRPAI
jgi:hypothetical protein